MACYRRAAWIAVASGRPCTSASFAPLLFSCSPEWIHHASLAAMTKTPASLLIEPFARKEFPSLEKKLFGLTFPNPIGLAAGFDKNAEGITVWPRLGFGFTELGTVTPRPQPGQPEAARLPAARRAGPDQPARLSECRCGGSRAPAGMPQVYETLAGHAGRAKPRQEQGYAADRGGSRLRQLLQAHARSCRLFRRQCQLAEHARVA